MWLIILDVLIYVLIGASLIAGLVLTAFALPGVWLIWIVILLTGIFKGFDEIPLWFVILSFFFSVFVSLIDNFVIAYGSKKFGGGKWGMLGGILGAILGLLVAHLPGLIIGPFIGAFALEHFMAKKNYGDSFKAGFGSSIGVIVSIVLKLFFTFFMVITYLYVLIF